MIRAARWIGVWMAVALTAFGALPAAASPFSDWAVVVVAGDSRGHGGGPTEAFDNARRDVAAAFRGAGFASGNIRQFSVRPERYKDAAAHHSDLQSVYDGLTAVAASAPGGCLFYLTSHGAPQGAVVGDQLMAPLVLAGMLRDACGARPTVAVISACFSGVFVPALAGPNRMILTAARPDRSSFGCGEADRYPYFDECVLQVMPQARDFARLGPDVQACVSARERVEHAAPPSEPQLWIGPQLRPMLPLYSFAHSPDP
ncbi:C13 family peptidase [Phenylobacterium immobile]|uniref:C13 family peptidase n=1 Tax=Phenylobacterium immobile TaxID=21 RepID=UPI000AA30CF5|nr:C13 family peptidase [Phenylobacterium immobile]